MKIIDSDVWKMPFLVGLASAILFNVSCVRTPVRSASEAMRLSPSNIQLSDDLQGIGIVAAIDSTLKVWARQRAAALLKKLPENEFGTFSFMGPMRPADLKPPATEPLAWDQKKMVFGDRVILKSVYARALIWVRDRVRSVGWNEALKAEVSERFEFREVYGRKNWGEILVTSYYEPVINASRVPTDVMTQAVFTTPKDLVKIQLDQFVHQLPSLKALKGQILEQKSSGLTLRGRVSQAGAPGGPVIVPYYNRAAIDGVGPLANRDLELAWMDPIDAFFLQIQGSGTLVFEDGELLRLGYASQNGHPYVPIGKFLFHVIPRKEMSMQKIRDHLAQLSESGRQALLNKNPSYVFFQINAGEPITHSGAEVVAGRSVATDYRLFPKGALALLMFEKPNPKANANQKITHSTVTRLVMDQDTGGAIRGPGRLDLFWGRGAHAAQMAGAMKGKGKLYYLAPKPEWVKTKSFQKIQLM